MDVLQLLKAEFRQRRSELSALDSPEAGDELKSMVLAALQAHLAWESDFLLPELTHISSRGDVLFQKYQQSLGRMSQVVCKSEYNGEEVQRAFASHTDIVEEKILPLMRQKIPTIDREELYHVFADAKHERMSVYSAIFTSR